MPNISESGKEILLNNPLYRCSKNGSRSRRHVFINVLEICKHTCHNILKRTLRYNNPTGAGTTTSGGTESIVMAVKTHRDWAREKKGIKKPEM